MRSCAEMHGAFHDYVSEMCATANLGWVAWSPEMDDWMPCGLRCNVPWLFLCTVLVAIAVYMYGVSRAHVALRRAMNSALTFHVTATA